MTGMKRLRKLIAAWTTTSANPVTEITRSRDAMRPYLVAAIEGKTNSKRDIALFDAVFADAIDLAKSKEQKTEAAS
jgi:hypothetical protein